MPTLYDVAAAAPIGTITDEQLRQLTDALEEESSTDRDYYINRSTTDLLEQKGVDTAVVRLLRDALGAREEMDIRWERT